jgi:hypothetical protein
MTTAAIRYRRARRNACARDRLSDPPGFITAIYQYGGELAFQIAGGKFFKCSSQPKETDSISKPVKIKKIA